MTRISKHLLIGITALGLGAGSFATYAQEPGRERPAAGPMSSQDHDRFDQHMKERIAKRQAELHEKLKLSAAQEPAWKTFTEKMRPTNPPSRPDRDEMAKLSVPERMEKQLAMMKDSEKRMADRLAAVRQFYAVLTPEQQKIFNDQFSYGRHRRHAP